MEYLLVMREAARRAGAFMRSTNTAGKTTQKTEATDFVTVADIKSQDLLRKHLAAHFAGAIIVSEEDSPELRDQLFKPEFTGFVLDPIDGTYNFNRHMQESAVSIGYIQNGQPQYAVVYDPYKDELFEATAGEGARCNGRPIKVSDQAKLEGASVATSNGYNYAAAKRNFERHLAIYDASGVMPWTSCPGSAVLVLAWIAAGRIDAIHHTGFKPWDNAAGMLLVREAGGFVHTLQGEEARFTDNALLAASPKVGAALEAIFTELDPALLT